MFRLETTTMVECTFLCVLLSLDALSILTLMVLTVALAGQEAMAYISAVHEQAVFVAQGVTSTTNFSYGSRMVDSFPLFFLVVAE